MQFASARAQADATSVLPFLAGTKLLTARQYREVEVANAHVAAVPTALSIVVVLLTGFGAGLCVPRLPRGVPRRGFDMNTWLAVLHGDGLANQLPVMKGGLENGMHVYEVDKRVGDLRVRYFP